VEQQGAATAEIARNVTETATAANAVTSRITEVSAEAGETDTHAIKVDDNAIGLATEVDKLKHAIVRVVRTSTPEVNRRQSVRHKVDLTCELGLPGQGTRPARLCDISQHGACILAGPQMTLGSGGTLHVGGFGFPVPFTVRSCTNDELHVAFTLDATTEQKLAAAVQKLVQQRLAA
jgi:methyl-accepting chemotaxis protein